MIEPPLGYCKLWEIGEPPIGGAVVDDDNLAAVFNVREGSSIEAARRGRESPPGPRWLIARRARRHQM
jgi:hypothetical protein